MSRQLSSDDILHVRHGLRFHLWRVLCESPPVLPDPLDQCRDRATHVLTEEEACFFRLFIPPFVSPIVHEVETIRDFVPSISRRLRFAEQISDIEN